MKTFLLLFNVKLIWSLLAALPEVLKILEILRVRIGEAEVKRKMKTELKTIHEAFLEKDPSKLNDLFSK